MKMESMLMLGLVGLAGYFAYREFGGQDSFFGDPEPTVSVPDGGIPVGATPGSYATQGVPMQSPNIVRDFQQPTREPLPPVLVHDTRPITPYVPPSPEESRSAPVRGRSRAGNIPIGLLEGFSNA
jgi:hypothetical protein